MTLKQSFIFIAVFKQLMNFNYRYTLNELVTEIKITIKKQILNMNSI